MYVRPVVSILSQPNHVRPYLCWLQTAICIFVLKKQQHEFSQQKAKMKVFDKDLKRYSLQKNMYIINGRIQRRKNALWFKKTK